MQKKRTQAQPKKQSRKKATTIAVKNVITVQNNSNLMALIIMYLEPERQMEFQCLSKRFYNVLVPYAMMKCNNLPRVNME